MNPDDAYAAFSQSNPDACEVCVEEGRSPVNTMVRIDQGPDGPYTTCGQHP